MLTPISLAGTETASGLVSTIVYFVHAVQGEGMMSWVMLGMTAYPEVQKKCQEELDRVIGRSRMPTLADRDSLPYICATVREALRWRSPTPLGESLPKMNLIIHPMICDAGLPHYAMEVRLSHLPAGILSPCHFSRTTGTKDSSFPKERCVSPTHGTIPNPHFCAPRILIICLGV